MFPNHSGYWEGFRYFLVVSDWLVDMGRVQIYSSCEWLVSGYGKGSYIL